MNKNSDDSDSDSEDEDDDDVPIVIGPNPWDSLLLSVFNEMHERKGLFNSRKWLKVNEKTKLSVVVKLFNKMKKRYKNTKYGMFAYLALDLIKKPGGNGGNERFFNPVRHLHRWDRNRMSTEILDACLYIYINERCLARKGIISLN